MARGDIPTEPNRRLGLVPPLTFRSFGYLILPSNGCPLGVQGMLSSFKLMLSLALRPPSIAEPDVEYILLRKG